MRDAAGVNIDEVLSVACRLKIGVLRVTELTTEGRINSWVTNQTVSHRGEMRGGFCCLVKQPTVASLAEVLTLQLVPHFR